MSIEQDILVGPGGSEPPGPPGIPDDVAEFFDAMEDSTRDAAGCGDVGFAARLDRWWWLEMAAEQDRTEPPQEARALGTGPPPPEDWAEGGDDDAGWVPADPMDRAGRVRALELAGRLKNQADAGFLSAVQQTGHAQCLSDDQGLPRRDGSATTEVGAALRHCVGAAGATLSFAEAVCERLPRLYQAMADGWLDWTKAAVFVSETRDMPHDLAGMVTGQVLPEADGLAVRTLAERIGTVAVQLDPDWAERREQAAHRRVRVEYRRNRSGTGDVAVRDITAEAQARIRARSDALVGPLRRAARDAGIPLGLPALRALAHQRLLDGTYAGLDDDALLEALIRELPAWWIDITTGDDPETNDGGPGPDDPGPDDPGPDDPGPDDPGPDDDRGPAGGGADGGTSDGGTSDGGSAGGAQEPEGQGPVAGDRGPAAPAGPAPTDPAPTDPGPADCGSGRHGVGVRVGTVELRMPLSTALGLDDLPAELPGTGRLTARRARRMLTRTRDGDVPVEWRVVLTDDAGHLDHVVLARPDHDAARRRSRPGGHGGRPGRPRGLVIVELAAATTTLAALDPELRPDWAGLIRRAQHQLAALAARGGQLGGPNHPATSLADARKRFPGAALERWTRVRDRYCIGPLCTGTAYQAEIDHTRDWNDHGPTVAGNLGAPCPRCHTLKHEHGWTLTQPEPGRFQWLSPLGARCTVERRPVHEPVLPASPRPDRRPRPVLDARRPPRPEHTGWLQPRIQIIAPDEIPTLPETREADSYPDEPPY